ncbi:UDP-3-O-[3-hydroxymyristoyl] N-acetylglucosamine deacetylase [Pseudoxanthobacter soli DSM 19599]|uniref:UDP-3-O-acyl-N-acetylglucosamine deacetylase n=1 Tax=Pseudoxanthobacter soli DSM 19599 TaxID=1123029 RepID=A0A1M7ZDR6_9HYPH|nr:UDP-3-O-acyl-N-acetylglucosamine deacetylase [Pseudoxanthobacter soli]SHO63071.1 UDP-3-O-[3-hydroxymyristoyl] N-acetylglucosamine deacetylase [Pseudoxanthobacter soli DSM 19599]
MARGTNFQKGSFYQKTLAGQVRLSGIGVHSGAPAEIVLNPAESGTGIVFVRTDAGTGKGVEATWKSVTSTELCTVVSAADGTSVSTIEHLMAALRAYEIDNVVVEVDGPEMPIMDGSAAPFIEAFESVGIVAQAARRRQVRVLKPVRVAIGDGWGELHPSAETRFEIEIDFPLAIIGRQELSFDLTPEFFRTEIARARTFGRLQDVERLWAKGLARGSSLENSVALDGERVLNPEGLRWSNEFVRHKALDAIGDLALAGMPIVGLYRSYKGGHRINAAIVEALFADETAFEIVEGSMPRREPVQVHAGLAVGLARPAYGPERT